MRHLELFAGIGGFRRAMDLLTQDHIMDFHCIGYSEIDAKAVKTYCANYHPEVDGELRKCCPNGDGVSCKAVTGCV